MKKNFLRIISVIVLVFTLVSLTCLTSCVGGSGDTPDTSDVSENQVSDASADSGEKGEAGSESNPWRCGENVEATLIDGTLWISGTGDMADFETPELRQWDSVSDQISGVFIDTGITGIGKNAFFGLGMSQDYFDIFISDSLKTIGDSAFEGVKFSDSSILTFPKGLESIGEKAFADSTLQKIHFDGPAPKIAENAFENMTADIYVLASDTSWNAETKLPYGGELKYINEFVFSYEDYLGDEQIGYGSVHAYEGEEFEYEATANADENCKFVRWEVVSGDLKLDDPTNPLIKTVLTGDVTVKAIFEK